MLPVVDAVFTLLHQLATRSKVTDVAAPKWLVQRHGLAPLTARAGVATFRQDHVQSALHWARIEQDLPPITRALEAAGVPVAPVKGVAYATTLYDTPAERPMNDIDLLVPPDCVTTAQQVLREQGLTPVSSAVLHHAEPWMRGSDLMIDLHWNIIAPGRSRIDLDAVWSRTVPTAWPEGSRALEPSDLLVFHLVHLIRNGLRLPLVNVIDADRLCARADVKTALERARSWGLGPQVAAALRFCRRLLDPSDDGSPAGWRGPSRADVALLAEPATVDKLVFGVTMAGSPRQLASRVVQFGANQVRDLLLRGRIGEHRRR